MNSIYYGWRVSCFHHGEVLCNTQQMDNFTSNCKLRECAHIKLLINARMHITSQFYCEWHISQLFKCSLKEFGALKVHILCFLTLLLIKIILKYSWRRKFAAQLIVLAEFSWFFFPKFLNRPDLSSLNHVRHALELDYRHEPGLSLRN